MSNELEAMRCIADCMRECGILGVKLPSGFELRLDPNWHAPSAPVESLPRELSDEEKAKELAALRSAAERRPFRHVR
jgi:hypothetical protein